MCQGLLQSRRHIEKREDPGDEVGGPLLARMPLKSRLQVSLLEERNVSLLFFAKHHHLLWMDQETQIHLGIVYESRNTI